MLNAQRREGEECTVTAEGIIPQQGLGAEAQSFFEQRPAARAATEQALEAD